MTIISTRLATRLSCAISTRHTSRRYLKLAGDADSENKAARILSLETRIAQRIRSRLRCRRRLQAKQSMETRRLLYQGARARLGRVLPISRTCRTAGLHRMATIGCDWCLRSRRQREHRCRGRTTSVFTYWNTMPSVLPKAIAAEHFAFYGHDPVRSAADPGPNQQAITATNGALGQAVGQLYVQLCFPPRQKPERRRWSET